MATQILTPNPMALGRIARRQGGIRASWSNRRDKASGEIAPGAAKCASYELSTAERESQVLDLVPLVRRMAVKMRRTLPAHIELDDLVSAGVLGLLDATKKFDARKQVRIESYARHRIRGAILDGLRSLDTASRDLRKKNKRIEKTIRDLETNLGRRVEDGEAANALGVSLEKWHHDLQELQAAGVDCLRSGVSKSCQSVDTEDLPALNQPNPFDLCYSRERREIAHRALACLPARERTIITLYDSQEMTMKQIGDRLRIDESRVSQLHSVA
ncbi:MAG: sigma-70 family RNA polymerase sigma factor, partial [Deltaproteobacteria bacterium]